METLFWIGLSLSLVAIVSSVVSLWQVYRDGSFHELRSLVRQIDLDLHELFDTVEKWTRRDRVRRLREGREAAGEVQQALPLPGTKEYKSMLRSKASLQ